MHGYYQNHGPMLGLSVLIFKQDKKYIKNLFFILDSNMAIKIWNSQIFNKDIKI